MSQKTKVRANASASRLRLSPSAVECMKDGIPCSWVKRNLYALKWIDSVLFKAVSALVITVTENNIKKIMESKLSEKLGQIKYLPLNIYP